MSEPHPSEIARFREQQALEEESARLALIGYAITARHDFITARAQRGAERILRLIDEGKHAEAQALMNTENWGIEDNEPVAQGKDTSKQKTRGRKGTQRA